MKSLDMKEKEKLQSYADASRELVKASKDGDEDAFAEAMTKFAACIEQSVIQEAKATADTADTEILKSRGQRVLTQQERACYESFIEAAKSKSPKQAFTNMDLVLPETVIDEVFVGLQTDHPLLEAIDFVNTGAAIEWLINKNPRQMATWSPLCAEIVKELSSGFDVINMTLCKLSAFLPMCKAMLDLGPVWLDRYIRAVLQEALYLGLEDGILNGRGTGANASDPHEPAGMKRDISAAFDPTNGYPSKTPVALTTFNPTDIGALLATIATDADGKPRRIGQIIMVVSPNDYYTKVFPATTVRTTSGSYNRDVLPYPITIIQSVLVEDGTAILGDAPMYFMGIGTSRGGKIEYSDEYRFLGDERVYLIKLYGNGRPKDNNAFVLLDISGLVPEILQVEVVQTP